MFLNITFEHVHIIKILKRVGLTTSNDITANNTSVL